METKLRNEFSSKLAPGKEQLMHRFTRILQHLIILAVFALAWFIPIEKPRPANHEAVPHARVPR